MIGRTLADVAAFLTFQVPVYLAILALGGADRSEMALAAGAAVPAMLLCARPFGLWVDLCRRILRAWGGCIARVPSGLAGGEPGRSGEGPLRRRARGYNGDRVTRARRARPPPGQTNHAQDRRRQPHGQSYPIRIR